MNRALLTRATQMAVDLTLLTVVFAVAFALRFELRVPGDMIRRAFVIWPFVVGLQYFALWLFAVPRFSWRHVGLREVLRIAAALSLAAVVLLAIRTAVAPLDDTWPRLRYALVPVGVIAIDSALALLAIAGVRGLRRVIAERSETVSRQRVGRRVPTILLGAGGTGTAAARDIVAHPELGIHPLGFVDDDLSLKGRVIHGLPVLGTTAQLESLCASLGAEQVLITITQTSGATLRRILSQCGAAGVRFQLVPPVSDIVGGRVTLQTIRPVNIEDLLRRDSVVLDHQAIASQLKGRVVAVTGAGGSIGSELCRQILRFSPSSLVLIERSENALFEIEQELSRTLAGEKHSDVGLEACLCDVSDGARLAQVFAEYRPSIVLHAAAHKHVPMMERNPGEAVVNNLLGTQLVLAVAADHGCQSFVMVSTDKAVRPRSVMGATKRAAERWVLLHGPSQTMRTCAVRFGNVLGSAGSVVPIFRAQIERGGPLTVTHPDMERYFMTIPEAAQLVLQAASISNGREIFVLEMGAPLKIVDLARDLIRLSGLRPDEDIAIEFTGVRPGEKLQEELSSEGELLATGHADIRKESESAALPFTVEEHDQRWHALIRDARTLDVATLRTRLCELVPEYAPPERGILGG